MKYILKRSNLFCLLTILNITSCFYAQLSETELHKKYWYYKTRLNNDFLKVGLDTGESIPFGQRGFNETSFDGYTNKLKAGDATAQLGCYIAVLATEYRLLKNSGQDVSKIKHEIFCALNSINRLDYYAEKIIDSCQHADNPHSSPAPNLNGFFVRDDVPANFAKKNYQHLNYFTDSSIVNRIGNGCLQLVFYAGSNIKQLGCGIFK
ncbi:MAG: hypothetical protein IPM51_17285 [Sphingobacteriaceae bacterium]|nr:hypothetical protein [Sphingobacteriaceae bacterium]